MATVVTAEPTLFHGYAPRPPLSAFVSLIWHWEGDPGPHRHDRILPTGSSALIVNLQEDRVRDYDVDDLGRCASFPGAVIVGAQAKYTVIDTDEQRAVMGVSFRPGGAFPFLGLPAGELQDSHASLEDLWGAAGRRLRERLLDAPTALARCGVLERALLAQVRRPLERHPAVAFALRQLDAAPGALTIGGLTRQVGLSHRRFIELFRDQVGLTPKVYGRIQRFRRALERAHRAAQVEWTDLALECGYFDQAHFIRDFKTFCGLSPKAYLSQRGKHLNHVPVAE
jgi:AraC-like DNA-binding protein